jgi:hypothetical protein
MTTAGQRETADAGVKTARASIPGAADCLSLAAAPTFGALALLTGVLDRSDPGLCGLTNALPLSSMTLMYGLMAVFHAAPWLRLRSIRR